MKILQGLLIVLCIVVLLTGSGIWPEDTLEDAVIKNADEAYRQALVFTGFERTWDTSGIKTGQIAKLVIGKDRMTPFLSERIDSQEVWQITFEDVFLDFYGLCVPSAVADQYIKTYQVLLDPKTGELLRIKTVYSGGERTWFDEPPVAVAEQQLLGRGDAKYFPTRTPPATDFYEALSLAHASNPLQAKELIATLLVSTKGRLEGRPAWYIVGRGLPPRQKTWMDGGLDSTDHVRSVIDATEGRAVSFDNRPHVVPLGEGYR
ncbi:MAG: hypothetical protein DRI32_02810 [Chloroflexi bacterium]|nr:MAG: hypothetical protein DRI32_02810 [Chloroflexota bacterium]